MNQSVFEANDLGNGEHKRLSIADLKSLLESNQPAQLVDVRSRDEFDVGHIPGALNIPMDQIESRIDDLARHGEVILVCQSGRRAGMTCQLLANSHSHVAVLDGGTDAWMKEGLPTVASAASRWSLERQVRFGAGILILLGFALAYLISPWWLGLSAFVGCGLTFAGLTNLCLMGSLLAKMPWNRARR